MEVKIDAQPYETAEEREDDIQKQDMLMYDKYIEDLYREKSVCLYPKYCNICGGKVEYIENKLIYGKRYGSGYAYRCTSCGAYVGTHGERPKEAFGILANKEMRDWKMKCHDLFDSFWKGQKKAPKKRKACYAWLANKLNIPISQCHFGYFDLDMLKHAYETISLAQKQGIVLWEIGNVI